MLAGTHESSWCNLQALSPVGRCKTFDASGDGYGRGEGCAVAVLQQGAPGELPVLAVLTATATNQDGRSSGLTAPNGPSQSALITAALHSAGAGILHAHACKCQALLAWGPQVNVLISFFVTQLHGQASLWEF